MLAGTRPRKANASGDLLAGSWIISDGSSSESGNAIDESLQNSTSHVSWCVLGMPANFERAGRRANLKILN